MAAENDRQVAEREVAALIKEFRSTGKYPDGFDAAFFEAILGPDGQLRLTYQIGHFPNKKLLEVASSSSVKIPSTDYDFPRPRYAAQNPKT